VAYRDEHVRELFGRLGFEIGQVTRGDWASHEHPASGRQDAVFAVKVSDLKAKPPLQSAPPGA
jgi:hypothetical protein